MERSEIPNLRFLGGRIIIYNFHSALFYTQTYKDFRRMIEMYGDNGFKAFFLHMILDLIERNMRSGKGFALLKVDDIDGFYSGYIEEVGEFLASRIDDVLADIKAYVSRA